MAWIHGFILLLHLFMCLTLVVLLSRRTHCHAAACVSFKCIYFFTTEDAILCECFFFYCIHQISRSKSQNIFWMRSRGSWYIFMLICFVLFPLHSSTIDTYNIDGDVVVLPLFCINVFIFIQAFSVHSNSRRNFVSFRLYLICLRCCSSKRNGYMDLQLVHVDNQFHEVCLTWSMTLYVVNSFYDNWQRYAKHNLLFSIYFNAKVAQQHRSSCSSAARVGVAPL